MELRLIGLALLVLACGASPAPSPLRLADGATRHWPRTAPVAIGSSAALSVYTHCGFEQAVIDFAGRLWGPVVPQVGVGNEGPSSYADPVDEGTITLLGPGHASYRSATGHIISLRPIDVPKDVAPCY